LFAANFGGWRNRLLHLSRRGKAQSSYPSWQQNRRPQTAQRNI